MNLLTGERKELKRRAFAKEHKDLYSVDVAQGRKLCREYFIGFRL